MFRGRTNAIPNPGSTIRITEADALPLLEGHRIHLTLDKDHSVQKAEHFSLRSDSQNGSSR